MKSISALQALTQKLKQQVKQPAADHEWIRRADLEREREQKYFEEQKAREEERLRKKREREE